MKHLKKIFLLILLTPIFLQLIGQEEASSCKMINAKFYGFFEETGIPLYEVREGVTYLPQIIGLTFSFPLYQAKNKFNISMELKPQFAYILSTMENYEFGLNVMFNFNYLLGEKSYLTFKISSGPHYINMENRRQATGFIFSDNFILGYYRKLNISEKEFSLGLVSGIRHISNASIKRPNGGINNVIVGLSFTRLLYNP
ncbi:acyloxyacyl hydrolase [Bacteroidota bacterium]